MSRRAYDYPASYVHDLIVTENYYILFDCPIKIDFPAVFTKYIFEKSCLSELICEDASDDRCSVFSRDAGTRVKSSPRLRIIGATRTTT